MISIPARSHMPIETDVTSLDIIPYTLGEAIKDKRMWVDSHQRNYMWEPDHIRDLYEDFERTIKQGSTAEHFLGSIVVVKDGAKTKVVDGQQRLATTTMLFAAMRDYFHHENKTVKAQAYQNQYLSTVNEDTLKPEPHLTLNTVDNTFFYNRIILPPDATERQLEESKEPTRPSNLLIAEAAKIAREHIAKLVKDLPDQEAEARITQWKDFIFQRARVIWMTVPDDGTAFSVFETMNDRGLRLSATDLLKNLLFALSREEAYSAKAQEHWFKMAGTVEAVATKDGVLNYVRHFWISSRTKATTNDLYKTIKRNIQDKDDAVEFAKQLDETASVYAALLNADHQMWNKYPKEIREDVRAIHKTLQLVTIRPLLLSGIDRFKDDHATLLRFFRSLVNWSVRFLVAGKLGSGNLEERYGEVARKLRKGSLKNVKQIREELADVIPPDEAFKTLFETMTVSQPRLQLYYLRTLESVAREELGKGDTEPVKGKHNIEHIIPKEAKKAYKHLAPETIKAYMNRLGNLVLLNAKKNVLIGDEDYKIKRPVFAASECVLTAQIATTYDSWGTDEIIKRQNSLAQMALKAWPIKV
jgi:hypothetical protein